MILFNKFKPKDNNKQPKKVYELWMDHTYKTYETTSKQGYKTYEFEGKEIKDRNFDPIYPSKHKTEINKPIGDVFSITVSSFCLNSRAYEILKSYLDKHCQIFEIQSQGEKMYVVNVTDIIDCLDCEKSEIEYFKSSGRIKRVLKYAFRQEKIQNTMIFKLPGTGFVNSIPFVTEDFKNIVEENNIKGFKFEEL